MASTFIRAYSLTCEDFSRKESELGLERLSGVCSASLYIYRMIKELAGISFATAMDYPDLPWDEIFRSSEHMDRTCPALDSALLWGLWWSVGGEVSNVSISQGKAPNRANFNRLLILGDKQVVKQVQSLD